MLSGLLWLSEIVPDLLAGAPSRRASASNDPTNPVHVLVAGNHLVPALTGQVGADAVDAACRVVQAEREPEIERAQRLQRRESRGQGDARSGNWRYTVARHGARLLGGHRWAQAAWLRRQHDLRFGSRPVRLRLPPPP